MRNPSLTILAVAATQFGLLTAAFLGPGLLVVRQGGNGTVHCESTCSPIINYVGTTATEQCTPTACCSSTFENAYLNCLTCVGKAEGTTDYSAQQTDLDQLTSACLAAGYNVPKLTFPGQNPNRPLPSFVPSSTVSSTISSAVTGTSISATSPATTVSASFSPSTAISSATTTGSATSTGTTSSPSSTKTSNASVKNVGDTCSRWVFLVSSSSVLLGSWIL